MDLNHFMELLTQSVWLMVLLSAPILSVALVVGVLISIVQAVTQVQEATLSFVPKVLISFGVLIFAGPWMMQTWVNHTRMLFESLVRYAH